MQHGHCAEALRATLSLPPTMGTQSESSHVPIDGARPPVKTGFCRALHAMCGAFPQRNAVEDMISRSGHVSRVCVKERGGGRSSFFVPACVYFPRGLVGSVEFVQLTLHLQRGRRWRYRGRVKHQTRVVALCRRWRRRKRCTPRKSNVSACRQSSTFRNARA